MARHLHIRHSVTGQGITREVAHYEAAPFTADELRILDAGRHVIRPDAVIVDLTAYYLADQNDRALRASGGLS